MLIRPVHLFGVVEYVVCSRKYKVSFLGQKYKKIKVNQKTRSVLFFVGKRDYRPYISTIETIANNFENSGMERGRVFLG